MPTFKQAATRAVEVINAFGFALIVGAVIYFIIGFICGLVGGHILDYTFCGSAHELIGVNWCGLETHTGEREVDDFFHHLMSVTTLPWFMMFWGFVLTGFSALLLKILAYQYAPPAPKRPEDI